MPEAFDPYRKWLGIPVAEQPPNHYRLLAIALFEDDQDVIENATDRQMAHLRTFQGGGHSALSQKLLNEVAAAKICLFDPAQKAAYDAELRARLERVASNPPAAPHVARPLARPIPTSLAPAEPAPLRLAPAIGAAQPASSDRPPPRTEANVPNRRRPWRIGIAAVATALCVLCVGALAIVLANKSEEAAPSKPPKSPSAEAAPAAPRAEDGEESLADAAGENAPTLSDLLADDPPTAQNLGQAGAPTPAARFLFNGSGKDEMSDATTVLLKNIEYRDDALYVNGKWQYDGSGYGTVTRLRTASIDPNAFTVALRFKAVQFGGQHDRIFGAFPWHQSLFSRSQAGNLVVRPFLQTDGHHELQGAKIDAGQWTTIACGLDVEAGKCIAYLNGAKVGEFDVPKSSKVADHHRIPIQWTFDVLTPMFSNLSDQAVFHGFVDELIVYDKLLASAEFASIPLRVGATSGAVSRHPREPTAERLAEDAARKAAAENKGPAKLVARFPFNGDGIDGASGMAAELRNVEFRDGALYLNGKSNWVGTGHEFKREPDGPATALASRLDMTHFTVALRFKAEDFDDKHRSILASNPWVSWFYMEPSRAGNLFFALAGGEYYREVQAAKLEPGEWTVAACGVDLNLGKAIVYFNGALAGEYDVPKTLERKDGGKAENQPWTFTSFHYPFGGGAFHGLVDELLIYDQLLTHEEFAKIPLRVETTSPDKSAPTAAVATVAPSGKSIPGLDDPAFQQWLKEVETLPAKKQVQAVIKKLRELNPGSFGRVTPKIENGVVAGLVFRGPIVKNLLPLKALPRLNSLEFFRGTGRVKRETKFLDLSPLAGMGLSHLDCGAFMVSDLSPLKHMPLTNLSFSGSISDLSPLAGMPLTNLKCSGRKISDLLPLKGMPLTNLNCSFTQVSDLSPLAGMPLTNLNCSFTQVSDLSPLAGVRLASLNCSGLKVSDLSPLKGMPLTNLNCSDMQVTDLSPLKDVPLGHIYLSPDQLVLHSGNIQLLRSIKTLQTINGGAAAQTLDAAAQAKAKR